MAPLKKYGISDLGTPPSFYMQNIVDPGSTFKKFCGAKEQLLHKMAYWTRKTPLNDILG
jgi:hypothetical protein